MVRMMVQRNMRFREAELWYGQVEGARGWSGGFSGRHYDGVPATGS